MGTTELTSVQTFREELHWDCAKAFQEALEAGQNRADRWVAAAGGAEMPTYSSKRRAWFLWVFNPAKCEHAWLNLDRDMLECENPFHGRAS